MPIQLIRMYIPKSIVEMIPSWLTQTPSGHCSGFLAKYTNQVADDDSSEIWLDVLIRRLSQCKRMTDEITTRGQISARGECRKR
jgi:hypothetical protein